MSPEQKLILRIIIVIVTAVIVYFLTGLIHIGEGQTVFLSRHRSWRKTLSKKGWHYVIPLAYHVSRHYSQKEKNYRVALAPKESISFKAKIADPIAYEYRTERYPELVRDLWKKKGRALTENDIKESLKSIGMEVISAKIPEVSTQQ